MRYALPAAAERDTLAGQVARLEAEIAALWTR
jgi:hypothetical protein